MIKNVFIAAMLMASTSAFATATTTNFSGRDNFGTSEANTSKISISYLGGSFDLSGVLDPSFRVLNETNSGLFKGVTLVSDADDTFTWAPTLVPFDLTRYTFSFSNLAAGNYTLKFNLVLGGNYTGSYTISPLAVTTPVPEPEAYGMMLIGLGLIGTIAFRRQKNV